jgi:hypothetical protein
MARRRKQPLAFARGERRAWPDAELWFHPGLNSLVWRGQPAVETEETTCVGLTLPDIDMCTWCFDGQGALFEMDLWCGSRPEIVDRTTITELVGQWLEAGDAFELRLLTAPDGRIQPSGVWLSDPLDLGLFRFDGETSSGDDALRALRRDTVDVISIAPDVSLAVDPASGTLHWILVRDIGRRQHHLYDAKVTREKHGDELVQALARLYVACARERNRVETKSQLRARVAPLMAAARDLGRRQGIDLEKPIESLVTDHELRRPESVIPPKVPPRR